MNEIIDLQTWQLISAYVFVIMLVIIVKLKGIPREKEILIASVRMTLQLILAGYLLVYVFNLSSPWYTILILAAMELFAIYTIIKRNKTALSIKLKQIIALSMVIGTVSCLSYFLLIVINISPWYNPRYAIPIAGMLIGNSMTGISLGVSRLTDGMHTKKDLVEGALMLGVTPKMATRQIVADTFDSAILPTINSMAGNIGKCLFDGNPIRAIRIQNFF